MIVYQKASGFTLIELLLSVTIIGLLAGLSLPVYESFTRRNDLDITVQGVVATLRRAETYARAVHSDSAWSVEIQGATVTLFQGTNFASRNPDFDETYALPGSIVPSGATEVQFAKWSAVPNVTGANVITLTSSTNDTRTISINAKGVVDY